MVNESSSLFIASKGTSLGSISSTVAHSFVASVTSWRRLSASLSLGSGLSLGASIAFHNSSGPLGKSSRVPSVKTIPRSLSAVTYSESYALIDETVTTDRRRSSYPDDLPEFWEPAECMLSLSGCRASLVNGRSCDDPKQTQKQLERHWV